MPIKQVIYPTANQVEVKIWTNDIDDNSIGQLTHMACMPFIHSHVAVMPDVHLGIGATIGSVVPTVDAVIPAAVGVDLGCGVLACPLTISAKDLPAERGRSKSSSASWRDVRH